MNRFISFLAVAFLMTSAGASGADQSANSTSANPPTNGHAMAPEFGPSVVFDKSDLPVQLADLRGKMTVVVFFQSWCPICNGWSPELLKQMGDTLGNDRAVALVAIKVDGGGVAEAKAYLKAHNADLSKWIVASDTNGEYYQRVSGGNSLWGYALIDEQGRLVERGQAGTFYSQGGPKKFVLADAKLKQKAPNATPVLPADGNYPTELQPVVKVAEMGNFRLALQVAKSWEHGKLKDDASKMHADLLATLSKRVEAWSAAMKGTDVVARYDAYRGLYAVAQLSDTEPGKAAKAQLKELKADKDLMKELALEERAESIFWGMIGKATQMALPQRKEQLAPALKQFAASYPGTEYAERAAAESETIGNGKFAK